MKKRPRIWCNVLVCEEAGWRKKRLLAELTVCPVCPSHFVQMLNPADPKYPISSIQCWLAGWLVGVVQDLRISALALRTIQ